MRAPDAIDFLSHEAKPVFHERLVDGERVVVQDRVKGAKEASVVRAGTFPEGVVRDGDVDGRVGTEEGVARDYTCDHVVGQMEEGRDGAAAQPRVPELEQRSRLAGANGDGVQEVVVNHNTAEDPALNPSCLVVTNCASRQIKEEGVVQSDTVDDYFINGALIDLNNFSVVQPEPSLLYVSYLALVECKICDFTCPTTKGVAFNLAYVTIEKPQVPKVHQVGESIARDRVDCHPVK